MILLVDQEGCVDGIFENGSYAAAEACAVRPLIKGKLYQVSVNTELPVSPIQIFNASNTNSWAGDGSGGPASTGWVWLAVQHQGNWRKLLGIFTMQTYAEQHVLAASGKTPAKYSVFKARTGLLFRTGKPQNVWSVS